MAKNEEKAEQKKDESEATLAQTDVAETETKPEEKPKPEKKAKSKLGGTNFFYRGVQVQYDTDGDAHCVSGAIRASFGDLTEDEVKEKIDGILDFNDEVPIEEIESAEEEPATD